MLGKNIERNRLNIDGEIYTIPQFYINHVKVLDTEISDLKANIQTYSGWLNEVSVSKQGYCKQLDKVNNKLKARNTQIADLKHRLKKVENVAIKLLNKYNDNFHNGDFIKGLKDAYYEHHIK